MPRTKIVDAKILKRIRMRVVEGGGGEILGGRKGQVRPNLGCGGGKRWEEE